ncbi:MAG: universal stress protein [Candidatus Binatia bacterium]|nr:universal stress protein [Candidatus Binatia bacterium]
MEKTKKILAPTDLSRFSQASVRHALMLAKRMGAEVTIYHVVTHAELMKYNRDMSEGTTESLMRPPHNILDRYEEALVRFLKSHFSDLVSGVKIQQKVELGVPHKNIVELAKDEGSDLIVISTHGRTGLSHMPIGSVAEKVVRQASCPVLSIHPQPDEESQIHATVG